MKGRMRKLIAIVMAIAFTLCGFTYAPSTTTDAAVTWTDVTSTLPDDGNTHPFGNYEVSYYGLPLA